MGKKECQRMIMIQQQKSLPSPGKKCAVLACHGSDMLYNPHE